MLAMNWLTSKGGQGSVGFGACPNWNHLPVPEYSIDLSSLAPSVLRAACSVPVSVLAHGRNAVEFALLAEHGLAPSAALRTPATTVALLEVERSAATIEGGRDVDIVA